MFLIYWVKENILKLISLISVYLFLIWLLEDFKLHMWGSLFLDSTALEECEALVFSNRVI